LTKINIINIPRATLFHT